jgi:hypothetical protein
VWAEDPRAGQQQAARAVGRRHVVEQRDQQSRDDEGRQGRQQGQVIPGDAGRGHTGEAHDGREAGKKAPQSSDWTLSAPDRRRLKKEWLAAS